MPWSTPIRSKMGPFGAVFHENTYCKSKFQPKGAELFCPPPQFYSSIAPMLTNHFIFQQSRSPSILFRIIEHGNSLKIIYILPILWLFMHPSILQQSVFLKTVTVILYSRFQTIKHYNSIYKQYGA